MSAQESRPPHGRPAQSVEKVLGDGGPSTVSPHSLSRARGRGPSHHVAQQGSSHHAGVVAQTGLYQPGRNVLVEAAPVEPLPQGLQQQIVIRGADPSARWSTPTSLPTGSGRCFFQIHHSNGCRPRDNPCRTVGAKEACSCFA